MFDDNTKKSPKKSPKNGTNKRLSSSSNNTESDGETGSMKDEQMVPNTVKNLEAANFTGARTNDVKTNGALVFLKCRFVLLMFNVIYQ